MRVGRATARFAATCLHCNNRLAGGARLFGKRQHPGAVADALEIKDDGAGLRVRDQMLQDFIFGDIRLIAYRRERAEPDPEVVAAAEHGRHQRSALADDTDRPDREAIHVHRKRCSEREPIVARCVIGIEPSRELLRMARQKPKGTAVPYELLEGSAEFLPFDNASMDAVVTTWTLCTIPDIERALSEMRRVLRPHGTLFFIEHGRATEPNVARWQDRLDPLWSRIAGGCHLNRPIIHLIEQARFRIEQLETPRIPGPPTHTLLFQGRAIPE
jgi:hypothetical protein